MNIIWLASYPKSGNTWLRFFLYAYIYGEFRSSIDIARRIPDIHKVKALNTKINGTLLVKTHLVCRHSHPYINHSLASIYILRHPKDILLSSLNYCKMEGENIASDEDFAIAFIEQLGVPKWRNVGMGSWVEHYESWTSTDRAIKKPQLLLKYEDMLNDPVKSFRRVITFLNLEYNKKKLDDAIRQCSFKKLCMLEKQEKTNNVYSPVFSGGIENPQYRFMNKGQQVNTLSCIAEGIDEVFNSRFKQYLIKWGY